jgi:hypothetical protein
LFTLGAELALIPAFARAIVTDVTRRGGFRETGLLAPPSGSAVPTLAQNARMGNGHFCSPQITSTGITVGGHHEMKTAGNKTNQLEHHCSRTVKMKDFMT